MKTYRIITILILLMASCHSSNEEDAILLNTPIETVNLNVANETFTVDFRFDVVCKQYMDQDILPSVFAELKTRNDLINYYKTLKPGFLPGYSSLWPDNGEYLFVKIEYMLAQECFNDRCDSNTRKEILQLVSDFQKSKYEEYRCPCCAQKTGVFLMAVILAKERNSSIKIIDAPTLQKALLYLNNEEYVSEDFSNLIVECSKKFLMDNNK